jgi:hypothetical protein
MLSHWPESLLLIAPRKAGDQIGFAAILMRRLLTWMANSWFWRRRLMKPNFARRGR